jgi:hypothetical protein
MAPAHPSTPADLDRLRQQLANWRPSLAAGKGELTPIRRWVWRLDLDGERYCVKGPREEGMRSGEAALLAALHAQGYPVPRPLWRDDEAGLFVREWIEGESLMEVQRAPKTDARAARLALCIRALAHLEQAAGLVRAIAPPSPPWITSVDHLATLIAEDARTIAPAANSEGLTAACREVARTITAGPPQTLNISDAWPGDLIVDEHHAVFIDCEHTSWWWPEKRFCQYLARWQRDEEDRDLHSREFLRHAADPSAARLDAHYLWHDLGYLAAWEELCVEQGASATAYGTTVGAIAQAARARLTWLGACEPANAVRHLVAT